MTLKQSPIRLAVAIPTMNRPEYLRAALRSVAAQTRPADEVFVFDNSPAPDAALVSECPGLPLRYENKPERVGVEAAFHRCFTGPQSQYVALLEDDNLFEPDHLARVEEMIRNHPDAGLYATQAEWVNGPDAVRMGRRFTVDWPETDTSLMSRYVEPETAATMHFYCTPVCASAAVVNRDVYEREPLLLPGLGFIQDRWMWAQLAARGGMVLDRRCTVLFRVHAGQLSHRLSREKRIRENGEVARMLDDLMLRSGMSPERGSKEYGTGLSPGTKARWTIELLRTRQWDIIRRILPCFRSDLPGILVWPVAAADAVIFLFRKMFERDSFS